MARLIDKDVLLECLCKGCSEYSGGICRWEHGLCAEYTIINQMVTIEAEPKHGRWKTKVIHDTYCFQCSACNSIYNGDTHYCPHCGAKMDGGAENG